MSFGISMHVTLQALYNQIIDLNKQQQGSLFGLAETSPNTQTRQSNILVPTKEWLLTIYEKKFVRAWFDTQREEDDAFQKGKTLLEQYYDAQDGNWTIPLEVEGGFVIEIGKYQLKGKIDRIDIQPDGTLAIIDYKSGVAPKEPNDTHPYQLYIYQMAAQRVPKYRHHGEVGKLLYRYLTSGEEQQFLASPEELLEVKGALEAVMHNIEKEAFDPTPAVITCQRCPVNVGCAYREIKENG